MAFCLETEKNANSQTSFLSNGPRLFQHFSSALIFLKQRDHEAPSAGRGGLGGGDEGGHGQVPGLKRNKEKKKKGKKIQHPNVLLSGCEMQ